MPGHEVFASVAGGGVDDAGAVFGGDVVGEDGGGFASVDRVLEFGVFDFGAFECFHHLVGSDSAFGEGGFGEVFEDDEVAVIVGYGDDVFQVRVEGDGEVGGDGPGGGGPDHAANVI